MSSSKWETHGGVRYKADDGAGSVDRDGWTRFPTNPRVIVCGHQEYTVVRRGDAPIEKWAEGEKKEKEGVKKEKEEKEHLKKHNRIENVKPCSFDEWVCLGGEYRDMSEVQEWAPDNVKEKLLVDYRLFVKANMLS